MKVFLSFGHKAVISPLFKINIVSKNLFYKSCSVWYATWKYGHAPGISSLFKLNIKSKDFTSAQLRVLCCLLLLPRACAAHSCVLACILYWNTVYVWSCYGVVVLAMLGLAQTLTQLVNLVSPPPGINWATLSYTWSAFCSIARGYKTLLNTRISGDSSGNCWKDKIQAWLSVASEEWISED